MTTFKIGLIPTDSLYGEVSIEFVAEVHGETLYDACVAHAAQDPAFARSFDPDTMTARGQRVVSLDHYVRATLKAPF